MFGIFKSKKKQLRISEVIEQSLSQGENGLHVNLYVDDQILFQVVPAKYYNERGIEGEDLKGFIELHFFNKNKTLTIENEHFAQELSYNGILKHIEEPKGNHNYFRAIGKNPVEIEKIIDTRIRTIYSDIELKRIRIEYVH